MPGCRSRCARRKLQSRCRDSRPLARASSWRLRKAGTINRLDRHFQRLFVTGFVVFEAHRRLVGKSVDQVAAADVDRIDGECTRGFVHQPLDCESDHRSRHAAIRRHGAGVGDDAAREALVLLDIIRARHFGHRHQRFDPACGWKARIGADIGDNVRLQREQPGVLVERAFERDVLVARMKACDQVFAAVFGPRHGAFQLSRQPYQNDIFARRATFFAQSRRRHPARSRAGRIPENRVRRKLPCVSGAASAWCR